MLLESFLKSGLKLSEKIEKINNYKKTLRDQNKSLAGRTLAMPGLVVKADDLQLSGCGVYWMDVTIEKQRK
jgi:hypothetical protein